MSVSVGGGGKRSVNSDLNLVPYIDLLSTLICFLLLTAVWTQIASLSTQGSPPGTESAAQESPPPPDKINLSVTVYMDSLEAAAGEQKIKIPHVKGGPDLATLTRTLAGWKKSYPDRKDVTLNTDSQAPYKNLINVMDVLVEGEFPDIGVNTK